MIENHTELLQELLKRPEGNLLEFKKDNADPERVGKYISALANMAALADAPYGYLVYGVDDHTHEVVGTAFSLMEHRAASSSPTLLRIFCQIRRLKAGSLDKETKESPTLPYSSPWKVAVTRSVLFTRMIVTFFPLVHSNVSESKSPFGDRMELSHIR